MHIDVMKTFKGLFDVEYVEVRRLDKSFVW